jgi:hypothetical protein
MFRKKKSLVMSVKMLVPIQNHQVHFFRLEVVITDIKPQPKRHAHWPRHLNWNLSMQMVFYLT